MPDSPQLSYARGATDVPLIEQTIGHNLEATVERVRRPGGAGRGAPAGAGGPTPSSTPTWTRWPAA